MEGTGGIHRCCPFRNDSYEENNDNGCLIDRMGGSVRGEVCEWTLALETPPGSYKLPGAVGSFWARKHFLPLLRGCHVLVRKDNTTVVAYVNRQGAHSL